MINCQSCGAPIDPVANFCGRCRKPLFRGHGAAANQKPLVSRLGPYFLGLAVVSTALVLGFLLVRAKQEKDARVASAQPDRAMPPRPTSNPGDATPDPKSIPDAKPERGAYGIPRDVIGPTGAEAGAIAALKVVMGAEMAYMTETAKSFGTFDELVAHHYLKPVFAGERPVVSGYVLSLSVQGAFDVKGSVPSFRLKADPVSDSGRRHFYLDDKGLIHYSLSGPATDKDPPEQYQ